MEVHRPKKPMHGMRDFLGEVGIIVIGVLLALGAEQGVEALHWRHEIEAAEDAMRLELSEDDGMQAYARVAIAPCLDDALARMDSAAVHGASPATLDSLAQSYDPPIRSWDEEAWKAVVASDVGAHMTAARLVAWSAPYRLMPVTTALNRTETDDATDLHRSVARSATPGEIMSYRRLVAQLRRLNAELATISRVVISRTRRLGVDVPVADQRALFGEATRRYGRCARQPEIGPESALSQFSGEAQDRVFGLGHE
jgi:hypothetical protein